MEGIRILLVDDQEVVREGLRHMLGREEDMEVVGETADAKEVLNLVELFSPEVIIMDIKMPGMDGIELTQQLKEKQPACNVIMLTLYDEYLAQALEVGAGGYLLKDIKHQELAQAIRRVYHGELVIDERLTSTLQVGQGESEYLLAEDDSSGTLVREVELVIPPPVDAPQLLNFIYHVEDALKVTIVQQVGSWDGSTAITVMPRRVTPLSVILDRLVEIPDVEGVEEKPVAQYKPLGFSRKVIGRVVTRPRRELLVTLKQTNTAEQFELADITS